MKRCHLCVGKFVMVVALVSLMTACSSGAKITRVDEGVVTDLSGRWNDTDSRQVAEAMIREALNNPWLGKFTTSKNRPPTVVVGTIKNKSHEHISVDTFMNDLARELTNSEKVSFVAGKGEREEIREERKEQAIHAREDTQKSPGKEVGADYMLKGSISTILDEAEGVKAVFYQVDLEMVDIESNVRSWFGQKKIKKVIERKRAMF